MGFTMTPVPFIDLRRSYLAHKEAIDHAVAEVIDQQAFILGPAVEGLEQAMAEIEALVPEQPELQLFLDSLHTSDRGLLR